MAIALVQGPNNYLTDIYQRTFSDVIFATTGGVQSCAPTGEVRLFSQNSASFGRFGCDTDNQTLIQVAGGSFVTDSDGFRIHTTLAALRQVPVNNPNGTFNLCLTQDEKSTGFLLLFAQLLAASEFLELDIGRRSAWCNYAVDFAVGSGVRADLSGACSQAALSSLSATFDVPPSTATTASFTGDCEQPCGVLSNISMESPTGVRRVPQVAVGFGDRFGLNVFTEQFVGPGFCFSAVDLLATCGSFRTPCAELAGITCPAPFAGLPSSGPFILQTIGVTGYACEALCPPAGVITGGPIAAVNNMSHPANIAALQRL